MRGAFAVSQVESTALRALNYSPEVEKFKRRSSRLRAEPLGSLLSGIGEAYGSVFTRHDCDPGYGIELLSQADMFASEPQGRLIRIDSLPAADNHLIRRWQVLVAGAGTLGQNELYGRSIITDERLTGKYVGPDAMVLNFRNPGSAKSLYAYAFLCTKTGIRCIRSTSYGTKILRIRPKLLAELPVPCADDVTITRVAALVRKAVQKRGEYYAAIASARSPIENSNYYKEAIATYAAGRARCLAWDGKLTTLAAWNYASTGRALVYLQRRWAARISDVVEPRGFFNGPRFARTSCEAPFGVDFWSQRDVFLIRPAPRRIAHPGFQDRLLFVSPTALLVGSLGQLEEGNLFGRCELAAFGACSGAITQHIMRVLPLEGYAEKLYAFLSTKLGLLLIRNAAVGTSIPTMHIGLLKTVPIPNLRAAEFDSVRTDVQSAVEARTQATAAEAEAVRIIEEEVLPEWLA